MESHNIEQLLEKYFEATATAKEEALLRDYFKNEETVADHLLPYAPMFQYFHEAKQERFTKNIPLQAKRPYLKWASTAAVVLIAFGAYFGNNYRIQQAKEKEQALAVYDQTKKAFALLAENLNKGTEKMAYLNEFETTKEKIFNQD